MIIVHGHPIDQTVSERPAIRVEQTGATELELSAFFDSEQPWVDIVALFLAASRVVRAASDRRTAADAVVYWESLAGQMVGPGKSDAVTLAWLARTELQTAIAHEHEALSALTALRRSTRHQ